MELTEADDKDWGINIDSGWLDFSPVNVKLVFPSEFFEWDQEVRDHYSLYHYPECSICNHSEYNRLGDVGNATKGLDYCQEGQEWTCNDNAPERCSDPEEVAEIHNHSNA